MDKIQVGEFCKEKNLPLHCDGARLFNAAAQLGVPASSLVEPCDSVSVCLSKGLGAPVGSVVVGKKDFIARFDKVKSYDRRCRLIELDVFYHQIGFLFIKNFILL